MSDIIDKSEILHELDNYEKGKGSWVYSEVDGVKTKVYTKYWTGTLDADNRTEITHNVDYDKILFCGYSIGRAAGAFYSCGELYDVHAAALTCEFGYNATFIIFSTVGVLWQTGKYRIRLDHKE